MYRHCALRPSFDGSEGQEAGHGPELRRNCSAGTEGVNHTQRKIERANRRTRRTKSLKVGARRLVGSCVSAERAMVLTFSGPGVAARERFQQQSAMRRNELRDAVENAILRHGEGAFRDPPSNLQENSWTLSSGGSGDTSGGSGRARGRRLRPARGRDGQRGLHANLRGREGVKPL